MQYSQITHVKCLHLRYIILGSLLHKMWIPMYGQRAERPGLLYHTVDSNNGQYGAQKARTATIIYYLFYLMEQLLHKDTNGSQLSQNPFSVPDYIYLLLIGRFLLLYASGRESSLSGPPCEDNLPESGLESLHRVAQEPPPVFPPAQEKTGEVFSTGNVQIF